MNDLSLEETEILIDAARRGAVPSTHGEVGEVLSALHTPAAPVSAEAPSLATVGGAGTTRRIARRTAVAASAAVLSLAGMAAAATGTLPVGVFEEEVQVEVIEGAGKDLGDDAVSTSEGGESEVVEGVDVDDPDDGRHAPVEGVDPEDGLDDEELEILCDEAVNHGHYVSSVARDKTTEHDGSHGARISESAGSECGKAPDAESADEADEADEPDETVGDDGPGNGNGQARGHDKDDDHPGRGSGRVKD